MRGWGIGAFSRSNANTDEKYAKDNGSENALI